MTRFLAVVNPTGGTGKTTTAYALAVSFAEYGQRTLLVDCTTSAYLTFLLGIENPRDTTFDIFQNTSFAESAIISTSERFSFLPSDSRISYLDQREKSLTEISENFRKSLASVDSPFDFVILDTPSTLSHTWMATLVLADFHLGVSTAAPGSVRGIIQTQEVVAALAKSYGRSPHWLGTLPTQSSGAAPTLELLGNDSKLLSPVIPRAGSVLSAELSGKSVLNNDNSGSVALAYRELAYFLLEDISSTN
jgi:cellulose biosynthesis protein BcsQ